MRYQDATATVNLLLNRASPWLDVESYLPFEGKVFLRNKQARRICIRIPAWVNRSEFECRVEGQLTPPRFLGDYLLLDPVNNPAVVALTFPIHQESQTFRIEDYGPNGDANKPLGTYRYRVDLRAGAATAVTSLLSTPINTYDTKLPRSSPFYPAYQERGYLAGDVAPMKKAQLATTAKVIRSW